MPTDPAARLLRLLSLLQGRPSWSGPALADRLGVTTRTVRRDVERLRTLGYRVDSAPGADGGYRLDPGSALPPLLFDDDEATAVAVALRHSAGGAVSGLEEASLAALSKLDRLLPPPLRARVAALREATVHLAPGAAPVDLEVLVAGAHACATGERLRVVYRDRNDRLSERRLDPHRMVSTARRWYLVAQDVDRAGDADRGWRTFRVDRVVSLTGTGHRSRPVDPPDAAATVSAGISVAPYRWAARVRVATSADELRRRIPPTVGVVRPDGADHAELAVGADDLDALAGHLVALGLPFEVLEPPELRARVRRIGARLARAHRGPARGRDGDAVVPPT
jgi:predicted DNA-binding transcriptional regulator YafY